MLWARLGTRTKKTSKTKWTWRTKTTRAWMTSTWASLTSTAKPRALMQTWPKRTRSQIRSCKNIQMASFLFWKKVPRRVPAQRDGEGGAAAAAEDAPVAAAPAADDPAADAPGADALCPPRCPPPAPRVSACCPACAFPTLSRRRRTLGQSRTTARRSGSVARRATPRAVTPRQFVLTSRSQQREVGAQSRRAAAMRPIKTRGLPRSAPVARS
mmetsp:Transcript_44021/g.104816  ORF Transcript_44021/g.104816 Transcript_44021/m.104816 type:complete len:213 (+) Transcript_44021:3588-4226(+)